MKIQSSMSLQCNYDAQIRIVHPNGMIGRWAEFSSIATLTVDGKTYIAGSSYGLLPKSEVVYEVTELPTEFDESFGHIDRYGRKHNLEVEAATGKRTYLPEDTK